MKTTVDNLLDLIRIPSVSSLSNRSLIDFARAALHEAQWTALQMIHREEDGTEKINLIAAPAGQDPRLLAVDLVLVCHTDTVPFPSTWKEATQPEVHEDMVHGCGACDVKGFLACLLSAASATPANAIHRQVRIILTADEETGCRGAQRLLLALPFHARHMIIGEPTSLRPARAGKGYCLAEVATLGAEAHSAHPQQGRSAIIDATHLLLEIEQLAQQLSERQNEFFSPAYTTLNVGTIHGGTAKNIVPARCSFLLEWRPIPDEDVSAVPEQIRTIIAQLQHADPGFRCDLQILRQQSGFETPHDSILVRRLESLCGRKAVTIPFGSEASILQSMVDEVVVWGPGDMRTAHSPHECVPTNELDEAVSVMRELLCHNDTTA